MCSIATKPVLAEQATAAIARSGEISTTRVDPLSPRRREAEDFIRKVFKRHHAAVIRAFAPHFLLLEQSSRIIAAVGWRGGDEGHLFLERYLDERVETAVSRLAGQPVSRARIAEVGHLASERRGGSLPAILALGRYLVAYRYDWVVFTATRELIGIFTRLGLPMLALANADPARLGKDARHWGRYYEAEPIVVAVLIRLALKRGGNSQ